MDLDEVTHYESPHQDLHYLQVQLISSLLVKELKHVAPMMVIKTIQFS